MLLTRHLTARVVLAVAAAAVGIGCGGEGPRDQATGSGSPTLLSCAELSALELDDTTIALAEPVAAGSFAPTEGAEAMDLPAFCRVVGVIAPAINFEVWLPDEWNGKFQGVGNGGMAGRIRYDALTLALRRGYATASTDTGHKIGAGSFDAEWAFGRPDLVEDYGHRGLHRTTVNGKAITTAFYGAPPTYSYYSGCSKGGLQGLMEAQRYPGDYDGIVAGSPAHDWTRFYAGGHLWYAQATLADPESYIPPDKVGLLGDAVNAACDDLDGIEDGVLADPRRCDFDPAALTCQAGDDPATCLTDKQATAVRAIWSGGKTADGERIYPGLVPGGESEPGAWERWMTGPEPFAGIHFRAADGFFKYMVFEDPEWDFRSFDWDADLAFALEKVGPMLDAVDPDIDAFRDRGGKLIVYHGWADPDISALSAIDYYEAVASRLGNDGDRDAGLAATAEFYRLFLVPGMGHCRGGPGPDQFDALSALEAWIEESTPPERIEASKMQDDEVLRTRPLCPYPQEAKWTGQGSTDDAANFVCVLLG